MKKFKHIFLLSIFFVCLLTTYIYGTNNIDNMNIYSEAAILMDAKSGNVIYEKNSNKKLYPASTTKILTSIIAIEKCNLSDKVTASSQAINIIPKGYSSAGIKPGEEFTVQQLLEVFLIHSANEAGNILAEHISGSIDDFVKLMNEKARLIGCQNTNFTSTNGVHDKEHLTTAYDLALIAKYCMQNETFRNIVSKTECSLPATSQYPKDDRKFANTNNLILPKSKYYYEYATGIKTGFTSPAKNCLISSAKKGDVEMICVSLGAEATANGESARYVDSKSLLSYGIDNYTYKDIVKKDSLVTNIEIENADKNNVSLNVIAEKDITLLVNNSMDISKISPEIDIQKKLAPIFSGEIIGTAKYKINEETYTVNLIAQNDIKPKFEITKNMSAIMGTVAIFFLLLFILKPTKKKKTKYPRYNEWKIR